MLILGDEGHYHGRFFWVTTFLVLTNVACFTAQRFLGERFTTGYSLVPAEITELRDLTRVEYATVKVPFARTRGQTLYTEQTFPIQHYPGPFPIFLTVLTSMFLHGDFMHLLGNMWFLLVFGRNVECAMGHARFLAFYILCGISADVAHIISDPHSVIPCLGASGAISGVLGAYVAIYPLNKVKIWLGWWFGAVDVPALAVIGFWFLGQYISVCVAMETQTHQGVAYWAHIGGFLAGLFLIWAIIAYLKVQVARESLAAQPEVADVAVPEPMAVAAVASTSRPPSDAAIRAALPDPFANFMPPPLPQKSQVARK
jgi:membrane associated rhomboid family serine protease